MSNVSLTNLIQKKVEGKALSDEDIKYFIDVVTKSTKCKDADVYCQIGAMLMAIFWKGLNWQETSELTLRMKISGRLFSWPSEWKHLVVDKHSTGGVGDKISLMLTPLLAALGLKVPMISGRSLGHTGGTLDKLESIPGYKVYLSEDEIKEIIEKIGCCIVGQTDDCVPADKVLYHCRDKTSTVMSVPLIIASIVSKKLSVSPHALVYDVKYGKGSFFGSVEEATAVAEKLVKTSKDVKTSAILTSMENPLGKKIGNSLEILEAVECLKGFWPSDLYLVTSAIAKETLRLVYNKSPEESEEMIEAALKEGKALQKFHDMILHQGVSSDVARELCYGDARALLPKADFTTKIAYFGDKGYVTAIDPLTLGCIWKEQTLQCNHPGIGYVLLKEAGQQINGGDEWLEVHHMKPLSDAFVCKLQNAINVSPTEKMRSILHGRIFFDKDSSLVKETLA